MRNWKLQTTFYLLIISFVFPSSSISFLAKKFLKIDVYQIQNIIVSDGVTEYSDVNNNFGLFLTYDLIDVNKKVNEKLSKRTIEKKEIYKVTKLFDTENTKHFKMFMKIEGSNEYQDITAWTLLVGMNIEQKYVFNFGKNKYRINMRIIIADGDPSFCKTLMSAKLVIPLNRPSENDKLHMTYIFFKKEYASDKKYMDDIFASLKKNDVLWDDILYKNMAYQLSRINNLKGLLSHFTSFQFVADQFTLISNLKDQNFYYQLFKRVRIDENYIENASLCHITYIYCHNSKKMLNQDCYKYGRNYYCDQKGNYKCKNPKKIAAPACKTDREKVSSKICLNQNDIKDSETKSVELKYSSDNKFYYCSCAAGYYGADCRYSDTCYNAIIQEDNDNKYVKIEKDSSTDTYTNIEHKNDFCVYGNVKDSKSAMEEAGITRKCTCLNDSFTGVFCEIKCDLFCPSNKCAYKRGKIICNKKQHELKEAYLGQDSKTDTWDPFDPLIRRTILAILFTAAIFIIFAILVKKYLLSDIDNIPRELDAGIVDYDFVKNYIRFSATNALGDYNEVDIKHVRDKNKGSDVDDYYYMDLYENAERVSVRATYHDMNVIASLRHTYSDFKQASAKMGTSQYVDFPGSYEETSDLDQYYYDYIFKQLKPETPYSGVSNSNHYDLPVIIQLPDQNEEKYVSINKDFQTPNTEKE